MKVSATYEEVDVLYISLKRPQKATDTKLLAEKGILLRYRDKDLVGVNGVGCVQAAARN